jgi:hypothetical protein
VIPYLESTAWFIVLVKIYRLLLPTPSGIDRIHGGPRTRGGRSRGVTRSAVYEAVALLSPKPADYWSVAQAIGVTAE